MPGSIKHLHVVSFDIPYPANYGGVIDVYYKIKALHKLGVKVHLHAFQYGRKAARQLESVCHSVHYYKRQSYKNPFTGKLPYIVSTRNSDELLKNLLRKDYPILFEGLHTCFHLHNPALKERYKMVRMHNIEHHYYAKLEAVEGNYFKKYFFNKEAGRLKSFEKVLQHANLVLAISPNDFSYLKKRYDHVMYLPAFHANEKVRSETGKGAFVFYHGNLAVGENNEAAKFLLREVFNDLEVPFYIAGNKPSSELIRIVNSMPHVKLFDQLNTREITKMTRDAHINFIPTFQATGIKLKLINVLYSGRFCLANSLMVKNTGLESLCMVANEPDQMKKAVQELMVKPFDKEAVKERQEVLLETFDNVRNARQLLEEMVS